MSREDQFCKDFYEEMKKQTEAVWMVMEGEEDDGNSFPSSISLWLNGVDKKILLRINDFYHEYENGISVKKIVETIINVVANSEYTLFTKELDEIKRNEAINHLHTAVTNYENNKDWLEFVPHERIEDLAVFIKWDFHDQYSVIINNQLLCHLKITWQEALKAAKENNLSKIMFKNIKEFIKNLLGEIWKEDMENFENPFFVLTTDNQVDGASLIADEKVLRKIHKELKCDYYILPSSIHEIIIVPKIIPNINPKELADMVYNINRSILDQKIWLSNNIYIFDGEKVTLVVT